MTGHFDNRWEVLLDAPSLYGLLVTLIFLMNHSFAIQLSVCGHATIISFVSLAVNKNLAGV